MIFQMGYPVIRAIKNYISNDIALKISETEPAQTIDNPNGNNNHLKISVATNSNTSWSKTFEFQMSANTSKLKHI